jgi:hypothetical protein
MPGRPKKNDRRKKEHEKPKGKKMSKHGTVIRCSICGKTGHNKSGCGGNLERGKKKNAHLTKTSKKNTPQVNIASLCLHNGIPHIIVQVFIYVSLKYCSNLDAVTVNHQVRHQLHNLEVDLHNLEYLHNLEVDLLQVSNHLGKHLQMLDHHLKLVEMEELSKEGQKGTCFFSSKLLILHLLWKLLVKLKLMLTAFDHVAMLQTMACNIANISLVSSRIM